jgi:hypothetical protein
VRFSPEATDGFVVHSFAGDDFAACREHVKQRLGLARPAKQNGWRALWDEATHPAGTPVEKYLRGRGLDLPAAAAGEAIRFHPSCPFASERTPAMLALVRDVVSCLPKAVHRTAIRSSGDKVEIAGKDRMALGPIGSGAVMLAPTEDVTTVLGVGEGIESTLSLRLIPEFGPSPVWALLSAGNLQSFPVLAGIESLWIAVDNDPTGLKSARTAASRWRDAGREVFCVEPVETGEDLNDVVRSAR